MFYEETKPSPILSPYVKCLWVLENDATAAGTLEKVLPDACPELIIHYGDKFRIKTPEGVRVQPRSFVFGPLTRPIGIGPAGQTGMVAARFYPGGAAAFLPVPVKELTNKYVSLRTLFGKAGAALEQKVCMAESIEAKKAMLEQFLANRLVHPSHHMIIPYELNLLITGKTEAVRIEHLSAELNMGRRHLERRFGNEVGMSPKMLVKIIRFQNIFRILNRKQPRNLTSLTYEAGYYDQSHFNRDFKSFTGMSPKEYFREDAVLNRVFTSGL
ncbi:MAG: helix-turn-helix domain-containing protein [Chitinophagaceae bacterium]